MAGEEIDTKIMYVKDELTSDPINKSYYGNINNIEELKLEDVESSTNSVSKNHSCIFCLKLFSTPYDLEMHVDNCLPYVKLDDNELFQEEDEMLTENVEKCSDSVILQSMLEPEENQQNVIEDK